MNITVTDLFLFNLHFRIFGVYRIIGVCWDVSTRELFPSPVDELSVLVVWVQCYVRFLQFFWRYLSVHNGHDLEGEIVYRKPAEIETRRSIQTIESRQWKYCTSTHGEKQIRVICIATIFHAVYNTLQLKGWLREGSKCYWT